LLQEILILNVVFFDALLYATAISAVYRYLADPTLCVQCYLLLAGRQDDNGDDENYFSRLLKLMDYKNVEVRHFRSREEVLLDASSARDDRRNGV